MSYTFSSNVMVSSTGKIDLVEMKFPHLTVPVIPRLVKVGLDPVVKVTLSGKLEWTGSIKYMTGFIYDSDYGKQRLTSGPNLENKCEFSGTITFVIDLAPTATAMLTEYLELLGITITCPVGLEITGKTEILENSTPDLNLGELPIEQHSCKNCVDISLKCTIKIGLKIKCLKSEKLTFLIDFIEIKEDLGKAYFSVDNLKFGFGSCPYKQYRTTLRLYSLEDGNVGDVEVFDSDGNSWGKTNSEGILVYYAPKGT